MSATAAEPELAGRTALITGGSSGIGAAIARLLAQRGASVAVNHRRNADEARAFAQELSAEGGKSIAVQGDVTDAEQVARTVEEVETQLGGIDILVANAPGISRDAVRPRPFAEVGWSDVEPVVTAQIQAFFHVSQAVAERMAARGGGTVVAVGAAMTRRPVPGFLGLGMGKAAVESAVKTMAKELGGSGVRVNGVAPGLVLSPIGTGVPEEARRANAQRSALGRNGTPEDIAEIIAFLASDRSGYLTGSYLMADGGTSMV